MSPGRNVRYRNGGTVKKRRRKKSSLINSDQLVLGAVATPATRPKKTTRNKITPTSGCARAWFFGGGGSVAAKEKVGLFPRSGNKIKRSLIYLYKSLELRHRFVRTHPGLHHRVLAATRCELISLSVGRACYGKGKNDGTAPGT